MSDTEGDAAASPATGDDPQVRRLSDWDADLLRGLADDYETPLYVLDLDRVRENYRRLDAAFPDADVLYAAKANALGDALATLLDAGADVECASAGEVERALAAGASGDRIHYTAVNPPGRDLDRVVEAWRTEPGLTVTVGAADTLDRLEERGYDGRLCLRVNPGIGAGHHEKVRTGGHAKFGVPAERAATVLADAADRGFDVVGLHAHVGSGVSADQLDAHREFVSRLADTAREVLAEPAIDDLEFVDVGGGFGVPYREEEPPLPLDAVAKATRAALAPDELGVRLAIEPGRYLVADAGVLLARVTTVKDAREGPVAGVDAGMTTLLRPAMYDAYHELRLLAPDADERDRLPQTVAGPICESADVLCTDRELPELARGDVVAIGNAGAYGYEMASQYNSRPRPASVVLEEGTDRLARRRETVADVTRLETRGVDGEADADQADASADQTDGDASADQTDGDSAGGDGDADHEVIG